MAQAESLDTAIAQGPGTAAAIFVLGVAPRSGTNFVRDLLCLHPDCEGSRPPIFEDHLLAHAELLARYAQRVRDSWHPRWGATDELRDELQQRLGSALVSFLVGPAPGSGDAPAAPRRLVTKTPSVRNLPLFADLFPDAAGVLVVRDGRAVVHSRMVTAGRPLRPGRYFERVTREWAQGAEVIAGHMAVTGTAQGRGRFRLLRYEDLVADTDREVAGLLRFAGLDPGVYDFHAARTLPVRGSSTDRGAGRQAVHWQPLAKDASFQPLERWRAWDNRLLERFDWLAGEQLERLGYERSRPTRSAAGNLARSVAHRLRDDRERWWSGVRPLAVHVLRSTANVRRS